MNLLLISDVSIQDVIGGAERVLYEQATRLAARGHQVHILTRRLPSHQAECADINGVLEWRYGVAQKDPLSFWLSTLKYCRQRFEDIIAHHPVDCINFHQPFSAFAALRSTPIERIRKIYTCHSLSFEEYESRNAKPVSWLRRTGYALQVATRRRLERSVLHRMDRITVLSQYTADKLFRRHQIPDEKVVVIPGGIDLLYFSPAADEAHKRNIRGRLGLPEDKMTLLTIRNLVPRMGIDLLLYAMRNILDILPDLHLIIGGEGPLKDELMALSSRLELGSHVSFTGFIPEANLPDYYRAADLFILPTTELEGFGLVTLEAMASGTPVLGTPVGGTKEILGRFDKHFLFDEASSEEMAQLVIDKCRGYMMDPERLILDSERARCFVETHYSWDANVGAMERLFRGEPPV